MKTLDLKTIAKSQEWQSFKYFIELTPRSNESIEAHIKFCKDYRNFDEEVLQCMENYKNGLININLQTNG